jgi:hypothetical protein
MTSTARTRVNQPTIVVPFFTDWYFNYNVREFDNHPIAWADKDYLNLFNDFDRRIIKQHNQVDKDTILKDVMNPCSILLSKKLYTEQMGEEYLEGLLEDTGTEYAFSVHDDDTLSQMYFTLSSGAMNQLDKVVAFLDYKQLGILINEYSFPVKLVIHRLPKNLSMSVDTRNEYTLVNVFEHVRTNEYDRYDFQVTFDLEDNKKITTDITEFYF